MPISLAPRNIMSTGSLSPVLPIVTNNPAFSVKIIPLDGRMEQQSHPKQDTTISDIKVGDWVTGEEISNLKSSGKEVSGKILQIDREGQEVVSFKILTKDGEKVIIDPTTAIKKNYGYANSFAAASESRILLYEEWLFEKNSEQ